MDNKEIVSQFVAAFNAADLDAIAELSTPEMVPQIQQMFDYVQTTWGEHSLDVVEMISEGDTIAARVITKGGHVGEYLGIAPTGKQWTNSGVVFYYFEGGKVADTWSTFDTSNLVKQLGYQLTATKIE